MSGFFLSTLHEWQTPAPWWLFDSIGTLWNIKVVLVLLCSAVKTHQVPHLLKRSFIHVFDQDPFIDLGSIYFSLKTIHTYKESKQKQNL